METQKQIKSQLRAEELFELKQNYKDANKALSLALWSYVGLVIPLIGLILAGYSLSLSSDLPRKGTVGRKVKTARRNAVITICLSILVVVFWTVVYAVNTNEAQKQSQAQQPAQTSVKTQDTCLKEAVKKRDTFVELGWSTWEEANTKLQDEQAVCFRDYP